MTSRAKLFNTFAALLATSLLILSSLLYLSYAYGANTRDTEFSFDLTQSRTSGTHLREKQNSSSVYVHVKTMTLDRCSLHVDGCKGAGSTLTDRTVSGKAILVKAGKYRIRNLVHESGEKYCRLTAFRTNGSGKLTGLWSPDCGGSYAALN